MDGLFLKGKLNLSIYDIACSLRSREVVAVQILKQMYSLLRLMFGVWLQVPPGTLVVNAPSKQRAILEGLCGLGS